jgi:sterol desaturase/sphingolipid hydroxylase (fatty acid hydroxylase superfamily)
MALTLSGALGPTTSVGVAIAVAIACLALALETRRSDSLSSALRAWWLDPAVATLAFACAIDVYDRRERSLGCPPRTGFSVGAGVAYWAGIMLWVAVVPPPPVIPDGLPTCFREAAYLAVEVGAGIAGYDLIFFAMHVAMHALGARTHRVHHSHVADLRARDVLTHSLVDGSLQVLTNILVQRCTPWGATKSRCARAIHNVVVTWMLTESHTCSPEPRVARRWCAGVRRHREHHEGAPYYQQFFGYADDLLAWARGGASYAGVSPSPRRAKPNA